MGFCFKFSLSNESSVRSSATAARRSWTAPARWYRLMQPQKGLREMGRFVKDPRKGMN